MDVLHLSEAEAYLRIWAARASRKHPMLLTMLADGRLHLTGIVKLAPHLTLANRGGLLERATHRSKRQILELVAEIAPRPDIPALVRRLPERRALAMASPLVAPSRGDGPMLQFGPDRMLEHRPDAVAAPDSGGRQDESALSNAVGHEHSSTVARESAVAVSPSASVYPVSPHVVSSRMSPPVVEPLSPGRYKVQFTASVEFHRKLRRLQGLTAVNGPDSDLAVVIEQAVTEKLERLEARRFAHTKAPRKDRAETDPSRPSDHVPTETEAGRSPSSRHIPAAVRRAVRERDGDRCRFTDAQGRRCAERDRLEYHHRHPFGLGGDHSVTNVGLMCRAHNAFMAEFDYGREAMARHRRAPSSASPSGAGYRVN
jgi:5-methylcytosine-specific restriction endonuclease McrA